MKQNCATCKHWRQNVNPNVGMGDCEKRKLDPEYDEIFETPYDFICDIGLHEKVQNWGSVGGVDNNATF